MGLATNLPAFLLAVVLISATPGPAFALVVRRTALRGPAHGFATILGLEVGTYVWALLVASGFAAVDASEAAYVALKIVGCAVLAWLAFRSFRAWREERRHPTELDESATALASAGPSRLRSFGEGVVVQLANPKLAVFLLALYPQFVPADRPMFRTTVVLALLQVLVEIAVYGVLALGVAGARTWFRRSAVRRRLEAVTGTVLLALGVRLALSDH
jgi:threonine/homoserine/homoserine lactone efflux protein